MTQQQNEKRKINVNSINELKYLELNSGFWLFFFTIYLFSIVFAAYKYINLTPDFFSVLLLQIMNYNLIYIHILLHERINDSINMSIWCIASRWSLIISFRINERKYYLFMHQYLNSHEAKKENHSPNLLQSIYARKRTKLKENIWLFSSLPWLFLLARFPIDLS